MPIAIRLGIPETAGARLPPEQKAKDHIFYLAVKVADAVDEVFKSLGCMLQMPLSGMGEYLALCAKDGTPVF